jgi:hypothetical protein
MPRSIGRPRHLPASGITTDIVEVLYGKGPKARHDTL